MKQKIYFQDNFNPQSIILHNERAPVFKEDYSRDLTDYYASAFKFGRKKIIHALEDWLVSIADRGRILDVGCGPGYFLNLIKDKGWSIFGIDLSEQMLYRLKERNSAASVCIADAKRLPFADNSFDGILSIETIRYFQKRYFLLDEIYRVLKPGGSLFITAAPLFSLNFYGIYNTLCKLSGLRNGVSCYQSFETAASLRNRLRKVGFDGVEVTGHFIGPYFILDKVMPNINTRLIKALERPDAILSRIKCMRNFTNHLVAVARKK